MFSLPDGTVVEGSTNGHSGTKGHTVRVEYLPQSPKWNRVSGSGLKNKKWFILMIMFGGLFFVAGIHSVVYMVRRKKLVQRLARHGAKVRGTIYRKMSNGNIKYEFSDARGVEHRGLAIEIPGGGVAADLSEKDEIEVIYDIDNPKYNIWVGEILIDE